jgi:hypothetical protein
MNPTDPMVIFKSERMREGQEKKMNHFSIDFELSGHLLGQVSLSLISHINCLNC